MEKKSFLIEANPAEYKILIVDDVLSNILLLKAMLKQKDYQVITANDGPEALRKVEEEHPDMILLDVMMPGMSGYDVAKELQSSPEHHEIPIIFITALNSHEDIVKGFLLGANDFISKPFNKDELMIRISHQVSLLEAKRIINKQTEELLNTIVGRDKLYSVIAHDLRGPLGTIKMILNMLISTLGDQKANEEAINMLVIANKTTEEVFALLDNLLKWTKSQLGKLNVSRQVFNICDIVADGSEISKTTAEMKGVAIELVHRTNCDVALDADMIKTVLRNLISNAIKFSNPGGKIILNIDTESNEKMAIVSVKDSGCGIDEDDKAKLLRADTHFSTFGTGNEEGAGLGLLLCNDFVMKNGGELWFESKKGEGSTFFFSIPKA